MFMPERLLSGAALCLAVTVAHVQAAEGPGLGVPAGPADIAALEPTIAPDGGSLPPGGGDASAGARVYADHCQACHGPGGRGGPNDPLTGGRGTLASAAPAQTVGSYWPYATTLFDYVRKAMPYQTPGNLSADDVYAVTAYLLFENGIIGADAQMNAATLPAVVMPNRDGFRRAYPEPPATEAASVRK